MLEQNHVPCFDTGIENTTGLTREVGYGNSETVATLLGPIFRLPRAGVIRPGIKVLKKGCSEQEKGIYISMAAEGATWDEIGQILGSDKQGRSKLIPTNVDYFTVKPEDCKNSDDVSRLHDLYADSDGKIRSLPVWFPVNEWYNIIPHGLRVFGKQVGLKFHSHFKERRDEGDSVTGYCRVCRFPLPVVQGKRIFGGRKRGERPCEPDNCPEYQKGECKFGGVIQCYIPGVKGVGVWLIPTTSWYSLSNIKSTLEIVASVTGGRIAGLISGKPVFRIRKAADKVSMINTDSGSAQKVEQELIYLDVDVDMTELADYYEKSQVLGRGISASQLLSTQPCQPHKHVASEPDKTTTSEPSNGLNGNENHVDNKLAANADKLFSELSRKYRDREKVKNKLKELTGVSSFYDLDEEMAENALLALNKTEYGNVKELRKVLSQMYGNGDRYKITDELFKLTGVSSFEELTDRQAKEALKL